MKWYKYLLWAIAMVGVTTVWVELEFPEKYYPDASYIHFVNPTAYWTITIINTVALIFIGIGLVKGLRLWTRKVVKFIEESKNG